VSVPRIAVSLGTTHYQPEQSEFYARVADFGMDFYTVVDSQTAIAGAPISHGIYQVDDQLCLAAGLSRMNPTNPKVSQVCAWEKALYLFTHVKQDYDYIWIVEYDVFTPVIEVFDLLNKRFTESDCLARKLHYIRDSRFEPWPDARLSPTHLLPQPWARAMVCVARFSSELLNSVANFVSSHDQSEMDFAPIEFIFHTIALRDGLRINHAREFKDVTFRHRRRFLFFFQESEWQPQEISRNRFYHAVKTWDAQVLLRERFENFSPAQRLWWQAKALARFKIAYITKAPLFYINLIKRYSAAIRSAK